jgi:hypothetical protein
VSAASRRLPFEDRRLRIAGLALAALAAVVSIVLLARADGDSPPATRAAELVPAGALVYLHLSTDGDREAVGEALRVARRFPGWPRLRDAALARVGGSADAQGRRALESWAGDEAALALEPGEGGQSDALVLVEVADREAAERYLAERVGAPVGRTPYRGTTIRNYGTVQAAFVGRFLALGPFNAVARALDLEAGRGSTLAADPAFRRATDGLGDGRVADAWATADGVRRLLAPAPGLLGVVGRLLDRRGLAGVAVSLTPADGGAHLLVRRLLAPGTAPSGRRPTPPAQRVLARARGLAARGVAPYAGLREDLGRVREVEASSAVEGDVVTTEISFRVR